MSNNEDLLNLEKDKKDNKLTLHKILIYGAGGFLIFVVGVIGFAIVNNNSKTEKITQLVPPEQETSFKELKIESASIEEEPKKELMIDKKKLLESEPKEEPIVEEETIAEKQMPPIKEIEKQKKETQELKVTKVEEKHIPTETKHIFRPAPQKTNYIKSSNIQSGYYVQVAALLRRRPAKSFLDRIKLNGYHYEILTTYKDIGGDRVRVTKVLIGPFKTREEAVREKIKIKHTISSSAFLYKVEK